MKLTGEVITSRNNPKVKWRAGAFSSALSSLIIVLDVWRDKKGRDWFSFGYYVKNTDRY